MRNRTAGQNSAMKNFQSKAKRTRRGLGAAVGLAVSLICAQPADLAGENYHIRAAREQRVSRLHAWLVARDGAAGAADALAQSIVRESEKHSLDPLLVAAVIQVESRFDRGAVSPRGAQGLMQVQQVVVDELVEEGKLPGRRHDLRDPLVNVEIGVSYLAHLHEMFGDLHLALAAYNWGPTRIREKLTTRQTIPSQYVSKVLSTQRSLETELSQFGSEMVEAG